jgi:uncharacterized protein DUF6932
MVTFDLNGYVQPYGVVQMDYESFVSHFVVNEHRGKIFEEYRRLLESLDEFDLKPFFQWINGSFVSRHPRPGDIDVVTFLQFQKYEALEQDIRALRGPLAKVDCYFVKDFPEDHPNNFICHFDRIEWLHLFSTDRRRRQKGFVQLNF